MDNPCYGDCYEEEEPETSIDENGEIVPLPPKVIIPKPPVLFNSDYIVNNIIKDSSFPKDTIKYAMVNGQKLDFSKTYYVNIWGLDVVEIYSITK